MTSPSWQATAGELLAGAERTLLVGCKGVALPRGAELASPAEALSLSESFDAIVWQPRAELRSSLAALKRRLKPGGRLLLGDDTGRSAEAFFRVLLARRAPRLLSIEQVCEALLQAGLLQPQVLSHDKRGFLVCARQPAALGMLDALFSQPAP